MPRASVHDAGHTPRLHDRGSASHAHTRRPHAAAHDVSPHASTARSRLGIPRTHPDHHTLRSHHGGGSACHARSAWQWRLLDLSCRATQVHEALVARGFATHRVRKSTGPRRAALCVMSRQTVATSAVHAVASARCASAVHAVASARCTGAVHAGASARCAGAVHAGASARCAGAVHAGASARCAGTVRAVASVRCAGAVHVVASARCTGAVHAVASARCATHVWLRRPAARRRPCGRECEVRGVISRSVCSHAQPVLRAWKSPAWPADTVAEAGRVLRDMLRVTCYLPHVARYMLPASHAACAGRMRALISRHGATRCGMGDRCRADRYMISSR
jgi:hypothetical protein